MTFWEEIETIRENLIDSSPDDNGYISFKSSLSSLEITDEAPDDIYQTLVKNKEKMKFLELLDKTQGESSDNINEVSDIGSILQTGLPRAALDDGLLRIEDKVKTLHEQGVDVLFLALGFLSWYESPDSQIQHLAPLLLIPVKLERDNVTGKFIIRYTGVNIRANLTLKSKLQKDFKIKLPDISDDFEFNSYMDLVEKSITNPDARWGIKRNDIHLGFFSFTNFRMYEDIDPRHWNDEGKQEVLARLFGTRNEASPPDHQPKESKVHTINDAYRKLHLIIDADDSQTDAIAVSKKENQLVIHGPPGTGKSQTIANIIGDHLSDGKKVLFVVENQAAMDVVKRRLVDCRLGHTLLELHTTKCKTWDVLKNIKDTLGAWRAEPKEEIRDNSKYDNLTQELGEYSSAVKAPLLNTSFSYFDAVGHLLTTNKDTDISPPKPPFEPMREWTDYDYNENHYLVKEIAEHLEKTIRETGMPIYESVFKDTKLREMNPLDKIELKENLHDLLEQIRHAMSSTRDFIDDVGLNIPLHQLQRFVSWISTAPDVIPINLTLNEFTKNQSLISELLEARQVMVKTKERYNEQLTQLCWSEDLFSTSVILNNMRYKWWRKLSKKYRQAVSVARTISVNKANNTDELIALVNGVCLYQSKGQLLDKNSDVGRNMFGEIWDDMGNDRDSCAELFNWLKESYKEISNGDLPKDAMSLLTIRQSRCYPNEQLTDLSKCIFDVLSKTPELQKDLGLTAAGCADMDIHSLYKCVKSWHDDLGQLDDSIRYNSLNDRLKASGLSYFADLCDKWVIGNEPLINSFSTVWFGGLIREAYKTKPILERLTRIEIENKIDEFKKLDKMLFTIAQETIVEKHQNDLPNPNSDGEMRILKKEILKTTKLMTLRKLLLEAGAVIQQIKPVFMMSPASVAAYLAPDSVNFDLLIFDEASQIRIEDSIGSILRAKRVVVVGDAKQLPPNAFARGGVPIASGGVADGIDSILEMFLLSGAPEKRLLSHYRSKHPSLISTANIEFYENDLVVFPTPGTDHVAKGLSLRYNPDNLYCGKGSNPQEARDIAEAVMDHANRNPDLSLGVIAFGWNQMINIQDELLKLKKESPSLRKFMDKKHSDGENFFVRNLERVQGDQRDVIFISVCFGNNKIGKNIGWFGAINNDGGARRLNVMITRATLNMVVFCNFLSDELSNVAAPPGVIALKSFLHFAETGEHQNIETNTTPGSEFEIDVINVIQMLGFQVTPQKGSAGCFIDICVKHPEKTGEYVLAIECDGSAWHSSASARLRDRLRQETLEGFGWKFHRIWSTDWFRNRMSEIKRLENAIKIQIARNTTPNNPEIDKN